MVSVTLGEFVRAKSSADTVCTMSGTFSRSMPIPAALSGVGDTSGTGGNATAGRAGAARGRGLRATGFLTTTRTSGRLETGDETPWPNAISDHAMTAIQHDASKAARRLGRAHSPL